IDPMTGNPVTVTNKMYNFGWEYTWHCHILGHEENDMMRPIEVDVPHTKPTSSQLVSARSGKLINLSWSDPTPAGGPTTLGNPANEIGFRIERATVANGKAGPYKQIGTALANATTYVDATASQSAVYSYRVVSYNATGTALSNAVTVPAN
ncbi:MAG: laccase, partial [Bacillota bacterium]|nr:laccase [Bacillota bacterium]